MTRPIRASCFALLLACGAAPDPQQTSAPATQETPAAPRIEAVPVDAGAPAPEVQGRVVSQHGFAIPQATVQIVGGASTTTDSQGAFSFEKVSLPYDLVVHGRGHLTRIFQGVSQRTPTVVLDAPPPRAKATIRVDLDQDASVMIVFEAKDPSQPSALRCSPDYRLCEMSWEGEGPLEGTLYAFQTIWTTTTPSRHYRLGTLPLRLERGASLRTGFDFVALPSRQVTALVTRTDQFPYHQGSWSLQFGREAIPLAFLNETLPQDLPLVPNHELRLVDEFTDYEGNRVSSLTTISESDVQVMPKPNLAVGGHLSPARGARSINLATQRFEWTPIPGAPLNRFELGCEGDEYVTVEVFTSQTQLTLPALDALAALTPGVICEWRGIAFQTTKTVDDLLRQWPSPTDPTFTVSTSAKHSSFLLGADIP